MGHTPNAPLLQALRGHRPERTPIWMMRQAGRHLPEYRDLRARAKDFLDFCYTPSLAAEATLQPVRRYGMDGAILFADILLVLDAMGLDLHFEPGTGPVLSPIGSAQELDRIPAARIRDRLNPVMETISRVRTNLAPQTALIGFAGAPWTVLLYAIEGRGKTDRLKARSWAYEKPGELRTALDLMVETTAQYMAGQAQAGVDALMIFDSWAENLPDDVFQDIIISPTQALVRRLRDLGVSVPIIGFPRGAGAMIVPYMRNTGVDALGLDTAANPDHVNAVLEPGVPVQGHLDPVLLRAGGGRLVARTRELLVAYADRPHIFNLGHGVFPDTPIPHVETVVKTVRAGLN